MDSEIKRLKEIIKKKNEKLRKANKDLEKYKESNSRNWDKYIKATHRYQNICNLLPLKYYMVTYNARARDGRIGCFKHLLTGYSAEQVVSETKCECEDFKLLEIHETAS